MPKIKTKKTLVKRVKVTKTGKIIKKQNGNGHLAIKKSAKRKHRKDRRVSQLNTGHKKLIKALLGTQGRGI